MKKIIIGNWKLHPLSKAEAVKIAAGVERSRKRTVVVCPPAPLLGFVNYPVLGAQDCFWEDQGAYTGQVSPLLLKKMGVKYCIVGHSENRQVGETEEQINAKIRALLRHRIVPVLCIGFGTEAGEDDMEVTDVLAQQLRSALAGVPHEKVVVAYEPVWAIGSGHTETPEHAERIAIFIKSRFKVTKVLYGGSVNFSNAAGFLKLHALDGLLVGGESLVPSHFNKIINA